MPLGVIPLGAKAGGLATLSRGEVSEWFMVPFSKSGVQQCTGSSNLPLSATHGSERDGPESRVPRDAIRSLK